LPALTIVRGTVVDWPSGRVTAMAVGVTRISGPEGVSVGVAVGVDVSVRVDVGVGVAVGVGVDVGVGVLVGVDVGIGVEVSVDVGVDVGVEVSVDVDVGIGVEVSVDVGVGVGESMRSITRLVSNILASRLAHTTTGTSRSPAKGLPWETQYALKAAARSGLDRVTEPLTF